MWTEEEFRIFVRSQIDNQNEMNPSAMVSKSFYSGNVGWRHDKLRAVAVSEIQLYMQKVKK